MEKWYIAFNTMGSPHDILKKLLQAIREHKLGDFVVRFCYEKGAGKGQYYVFVGVISEKKGIIPSELYNEFYTMLKRLRLSDQHLYVYFEEVKQMVSKELEIHNLRQIKSFKLPPLSPADPFSYVSREVLAQTSPVHSIENQNETYNHLLYWLSIYGRGNWQQFRTTCHALGLDPNGEQSKRIIRRLRSLGHIELSKDGQRWFIAPASLVVPPLGTGECHTFLAGQRSPALLQELHEVAIIEFEPQPYVDGPEVVRAFFPSQEDAKKFAINFSKRHYPLSLAGSASLEIVSALPDLAGWQEQLTSVAIAQGNYNYEQWISGGFQEVHLPKATGLYRLTHVSSRFEHPQLTLFYDEKTDIWLKSDWYGLRYLMLRRTGDICEFHYDHQLKTLSIPLENRLPDIYERSLVLASGRLPIFQNGHVKFGEIPETLAHILANKLEAEFIEYKGI